MLCSWTRTFSCTPRSHPSSSSLRVGDRRRLSPLQVTSAPAPIIPRLPALLLLLLRLFDQLLSLLDYYERFEVDDHRGEPLTDAEVKATRCEQLQALQRKAFSMEALQDFALANLAAVDTPTALKSHFGRLQSSQLAEIVRHGRRPDAPQTSSRPPPNTQLFLTPH